MIMSAKDKALELRDKHANFQVYSIGFEPNSNSEFVRLQRAKESALITVEEILLSQPSYKYWDTYKSRCDIRHKLLNYEEN